MVIGDFVVDTYTIGKARRISPEAPVAVVNVQRTEQRAGGAGNAVLNLISLGSKVVAVGRIGYDAMGESLLKSLKEEGVSVEGIFTEPRYTTPTKNRIIADGQQIVRVDHEEVVPLNESLEQKIIEALPQLLSDVAVVAISDYGKGFLTRTLLAAIIEQAKERKIPVVADPKGIDFSKYRGATLIKPNLSEAIAASGLGHESSLEQVAVKLLKITEADTLMITRSEHGISLFHRNGLREDFPVQMREIKDVTGAGDTVLAMVTCALANGLPMPSIAQLANVAAGIAIEHFGCARVTLTELAVRLLEKDVTNKVFDEEHLFALQKVLQDKRFILIGLDSRLGITTSLLRSIRLVTQSKDRLLLVYIRDQNPSDEFVDILASLSDVNFIILNGESLRQFCSKLQPEEVYLVAENSMSRIEQVSALLPS
jgi:D-beta-D-heptose 7-phosphate kinase/D-beta-D-heptose 1-phosphate adenosyltransferase